jgi:hypothetical protein
MPACTSESLEVSQTSLQEETAFGTLSPEDQKLVSSLFGWVKTDADGNITRVVDIYQKANAVTIGAYRIMFIPDNPNTPIYIVKDKKMVMSAIGDTQVIYLDSPSAPSLDAEKVVVHGDYLMFTNGKNRFESYGFNGIDVVWENWTDQDKNFLEGSYRNYRNNIECPYSVTPGLACCHDDEGQIRPYNFNPNKGWEILDNKKMIETCQPYKKTIGVE